MMTHAAMTPAVCVEVSRVGVNESVCDGADDDEELDGLELAAMFGSCPGRVE